MKEASQVIKKKVNVILPTSKFCLAWNIINFFFIAYTVLYTPIEWVSGIDFTDIYGLFFWLSLLLTLIFFIIDIIIKLFTAFFHQGDIVTDKKLIFQNYIKSFLLVDILRILPVLDSAFHFSGSLKVTNICVYFQIPTAIRILNQIEETIHPSNNNKKLSMKLFRLILIIMTVSHISGCSFLGLSYLERRYNLIDGNQQTWVEFMKLQDETWLQKYIWALYFSVTTMLTVGYGDISAKNQIEAIFCMINMFICCGVFAYSFNSIGSIIDQYSANNRKYQEKLRLINKYLWAKNIGVQLRLQVKKYFEHKYYYDTVMSIEEENQILDLFPQKLKQQCVIQANMQILDKNKNLFMRYSKEFQYQLSLELTQERVLKGDMIIQEEVYEDDPKLYFLYKGQVQVYLVNVNGDSDIISLSILNEGAYFGEIAFFCDIKRNAGVLAYQNCVLYSLKRSDFLKVIKHFPSDYENFCQFRDQVTISSSKFPVGYKCRSCQQYGHGINTCPLLHYVADKEGLILKQIYNTPTIQRQSFERFPHKTENSILSFSLNKQSSEQIQKNLDLKKILPFYFVENIQNRSSIAIDKQLFPITELNEEKQDLKDDSSQELQEVQEDDEEEDDDEDLKENVENNQKKVHIQLENMQQQQRKFSLNSIESPRNQQFLKQLSFSPKNSDQNQNINQKFQGGKQPTFLLVPGDRQSILSRMSRTSMFYNDIRQLGQVRRQSENVKTKQKKSQIAYLASKVRYKNELVQSVQKKEFTFESNFEQINDFKFYFTSGNMFSKLLHQNIQYQIKKEQDPNFAIYTFYTRDKTTKGQSKKYKNAFSSFAQMEVQQVQMNAKLNIKKRKK